MDFGEGPRLVSRLTVGGSRLVFLGRDGDKLGESKGNGFHTRLHMGPYCKGIL